MYHLNDLVLIRLNNASKEWTSGVIKNELSRHAYEAIMDSKMVKVHDDKIRKQNSQHYDIGNNDSIEPEELAEQGILRQPKKSGNTSNHSSRDSKLNFE